MTPAHLIATPLAYEMAVLTLYLDLPETPLRTGSSDPQRARLWFERGVPLTIVHAALLLGSLRRLTRPSDAPRLPPIRSLAYFHPIVEELLEAPVSPGYLGYLQHKMQPYLRPSSGQQPSPAPPRSPSG